MYPCFCMYEAVTLRFLVGGGKEGETERKQADIESTERREALFRAALRNRQTLICGIDRRRIIPSYDIRFGIYRLRKKQHSHVVDKPYRCRSTWCAVRDLKSKRDGCLFARTRESERAIKLASFVLAGAHNVRGCIALTSSICRGC